ncbi:hypothetical protein EYC84_007774 [Monilinia fructicola]|uniref:Uncharacterized protein n=1 Tax=Monilinia fructicola TaxID=38448 RepID=A0A5M9JJ77_MONFR|nr:hypothetical protein EYC84_007774 [Monilinia fructicola]
MGMEYVHETTDAVVMGGVNSKDGCFWWLLQEPKKGTRNGNIGRYSSISKYTTHTQHSLGLSSFSFLLDW